MIVLDGVEVSVPQLGGSIKTLLSDISINLSQQRISVIGPNGSGKSTFLRLLNGLVMPTKGTVTVVGKNTASNIAKVRKMVGFVFTDPLSQLVMSTPIEDVELSLKHRIKGSKNRRQKALELLAEMGLEAVAHQSIYDLSGGERQMVALCAVLAVNPEILVADEPTTLLDLRNRNHYLKWLKTLTQQIIYTTHDLDFAAAAQRSICIAGGKIVADGIPEEVIDFYARKFGDIE